MSVLKHIDWDEIDLELPGSIPVAAVLIIRSLDADGDFRTSVLHDQADEALRLGMLQQATFCVEEMARGSWRHEEEDDD